MDGLVMVIDGLLVRTARCPTKDEVPDPLVQVAATPDLDQFRSLTAAKHWFN